MSREHVIPKSLLGKPPDSTAWPIVLDVHKSCERKEKQSRDSWLRLYASLTSDPRPKVTELWKKWETLTSSTTYSNNLRDTDSDVAKSYLDWISHLGGDIERMKLAWIEHLKSVPLAESPELNNLRGDCIRLIKEVFSSCSKMVTKGHYRSTPMAIEQVSPPGWKEEFLAVAGLEELIEGVWTWIRGLHTFLYRVFLDPKSSHLCLPSTPIFGTRNDTSIEAFANHSTAIKFSVEAAELADKWDGITAWGGAFEYKCTWVTGPEFDGSSRCMWKLVYLEATQDTRWSTYPGVAWHGCYDLKSPSLIASSITDDELGRYTTHLQDMKKAK